MTGDKGQTSSSARPGPPRKSGKALGALACGVLSVLVAWIPLFGIVLGVAAVVLAVKAVQERGRDGRATAGKACGILGVTVSVISFILYLVLGVEAFSYVASQPHPGVIADDSAGIIGELVTPEADVVDVTDPPSAVGPRGEDRA